MEKLSCPACQSHHANRFGHQNGRRGFIYRTCQKTWRENPGTTAIAPERKAQILAAYHERVFLRGLSRIFGVSRNTISKTDEMHENCLLPFLHDYNAKIQRRLCN